MSQSTQSAQSAVSSDGLPTMGAVPLGPDEPELFTDAMTRIIRHLTDDERGRPTSA